MFVHDLLMPVHISYSHAQIRNDLLRSGYCILRISDLVQLVLESVDRLKKRGCWKESGPRLVHKIKKV